MYSASLLELAISGLASFFSSVADETDKRKKKKAKIRDHDGAELFDAPEMHSARAPRQGRPSRDSETKSAMSVSMLKTMSAEARDAVLVSP